MIGGYGRRSSQGRKEFLEQEEERSVGRLAATYKRGLNSGPLRVTTLAERRGGRVVFRFLLSLLPFCFLPSFQAVSVCVCGS